MQHSINANPPKIRNCVLCSRFVEFTGPDTVRCAKFGNNWPARETQCAFWEREPGADDETAPEFWRQVMERQCPPRHRPPLRPRMLVEVRAIMGQGYTGSSGIDAVVSVPVGLDAVDAAEEEEAISEAIGSAWIPHPSFGG